MRVLVTGATGFLGSHVARHFTDRGHHVTGTGRNPQKGAQLGAAGIRFLPIDLSNRSGLQAVCKDVETIVHCAALSTAWATRQAYEEANVAGTGSLVAAAERSGVKRIIHISTPAVLSRPAHQYNLREDEPYPDRFTSLYGETKAAAESIVAAGRLETAVLRPKGIYGPGDQALLPRLVKAARGGRLPVIGDGTTLTDLTYVDDVVAAIDLAVSADRVSGIYHITGPEPVRVWDMIAELMQALDLPAPSRHVSVRSALRLGAALEVAARLLPTRPEPPLTRYKVSVLAYSQTLDTSRIRDELGFEPKVSLRAGLGSVLDAPQPGPAPERRHPHLPHDQPHVAVEIHDTGTAYPPGWAIGIGNPRRSPLPILAATIKHPTKGIVRFDTGYGPDPAPGHHLLARAYRRLLQPQSRRRVAEQPDLIVISHTDPDHIGGIAEYPDVEVVMDAEAWREVVHPHAPWRRLVELPGDLATRIRLVDTSCGPADLLCDGSLLAVGLPGHAPGHIGLVVTDTQQYLLCGDAALTRRHIRRRKIGMIEMLSRSRSHSRRTMAFLHETMEHTDTVVVPSHCPETAEMLARRHGSQER